MAAGAAAAASKGIPLCVCAWQHGCGPHLLAQRWHPAVPTARLRAAPTAMAAVALAVKHLLLLLGQQLITHLLLLLLLLLFVRVCAGAG